MKKTLTVRTKLILFLVVSLIFAGNLHIGAETEGSAVFLRIFAAAKGSAASPTDEAGQEALLQERYDAAQAFFDAGEYAKAAEAFDALGQFSNSRARAADSRKRWTKARYKEAVSLFNAEQFAEARDIFETLENYEKSRSYVYKCTLTIQRADYKRAKDLFAAGDYIGAKALFESIGKFHDSQQRAQDAADMIKAQEQAAQEEKLYEEALALKESGELEKARDLFIQAGDCKDATDQLYAILHVFTLRDAFERAQGYYANGEYEKAYDLFQTLGDFENSAAEAARSKEASQAALYEQASAMQGNDPGRAYLLFLSLGAYRDSANLAERLKAAIADETVYAAADAFAQEGGYAQAKFGFEAIAPYEDSRERAEELSETIPLAQDFKRALLLREIGDEEQANAIFKGLGRFQDASKMIQPTVPRTTAKHLRDDQTSPKSSVFTAADGSAHRYQIFKGVHTWVEAKAFCEALGGHLATVTTAEENAFVYRFMRDSGFLTAYFGLSDEARTGNWEWVTGEPFDYSNWNPGEPSRCLRERYGMYFYKHTDGSWNDSHFYEHVKVDPGCSYICEWDE